MADVLFDLPEPPGSGREFVLSPPVEHEDFVDVPELRPRRRRYLQVSVAQFDLEVVVSTHPAIGIQSKSTFRSMSIDPVESGTV